MAENTLEVRPAISFKAYVKEKNGFRPAQGLDLDIGEKVGMKDGKNPGFATITAIVRLKNDSQPRNFVLTAGHAFRDVDQNWYKLTDDNNYIGLRADGLPAVKLPIYWGPARSSEDPCAVSYLQYRCAGDKLGSTVDAGLALLKPNVKVSQAYGDGKTITAFDEWPSEDRPEGQQYMLGTEVIEGNWRDSFELVWPTWDKKKGGTLSRVYIRKVPEKPFIGPGFSGKALIRCPKEGHNGAKVTLVAICIGVSYDRTTFENGDTTLYEIYQHISEAKELFNLEIAPTT